MDTDELSSEVYEGIIIEAEKFHHDLALQFGVLASACEDEAEYLQQAEKFINELQKTPQSLFSDIFFDSVPDKKDLSLVLKKILNNISEINKIPENKRHYEF